jgi:NTE family protein
MAHSQRKIGLVLGSGGARGWAHFGVLRALDEAGIQPGIITGASAGAMVGAFYAAGRIRDLHDLASGLKWKDVVYYLSDISRTRSGLVDGRRIRDVFRGVLGHLTIEELGIPFAAVATDVRSGQAVMLRTGDLVDAVRASISLPGIFSPVERDGRMLVDGGLVEPVPIGAARDMGADVIIAVNVLGTVVKSVTTSKRATSAHAVPAARPALPDTWKAGRNQSLVEKLREATGRIDVGATLRQLPWLKRGKHMHLLDVISNSIRIMEIQIAEASLQRDKPDILIRPKIGDVGILEFQSTQVSERAGYEAAKALLPKIREVIGRGAGNR